MIDNHIDDGVDIGDVDLVVAVHVGCGHAGVAVVAAHDDDVDHAVGVGDGGFAIVIHVTDWAVLTDIANDGQKPAPI